MFFRYALVLFAEFRWTIVFLSCAILVAAVLYAITPHTALGGRTPSPLTSLYGAWMALFAQPILSPPETWYLTMVCAIYPLFGFVLVGEGVLRLSRLLLSRQQGERKWMTVMASTYRDHVVLCGLGHLGYRILCQLQQAGAPVVALEKNSDGRFMSAAKETGAPVLVRDMKDDAALVEAGVPHARCIIIATDDDMANLEVALDARRMNPNIRVVLRMFDQQIASKVKGAFRIDHAFSAAAIAAPIVAAMSNDVGVLASYPLGDVAYVVAQLELRAGAPLVGRPTAELESAHGARILSSTGDAAVLRAGDRVVVNLPAEKLPQLAAAARGIAA